MNAWGRVGVTIAALCVVLAISACGDDEDDGGLSDEAIELLDHVPTRDPGGLAFVDFAAAREQLGLPEDADVADFPTGNDPADVGRRRLVTTAGRLLSYLPFGERTALGDAIDHGAIGAAASNMTSDGVGISAIKTTQPFDEIATTLEGESYTRDGNVVRTKREAPTSSRGSIQVYESGERIKPAPLKPDVTRQLSYPVVADGGDGVVVLGFERGTVENAIAGSTEPDNAVRGLIEQVDGIARGAIAIGDDCVQALAVGESLDPDTAELRIEISGEASADRFHLPELRDKQRLEYGEPEVEGETLTVEIVGRDPNTLAVQLPLDLLSLALNRDQIYEC